MNKTLAAAMAAVTFGGAVCATALPAQARGHDGGFYRHYDYGRRDRNDAGAAIAAGVLDLALGAALTSNGHAAYGSGPYYGRGYYGRDDYDRGYYEPAYRVCESARWVWDPYIRERVLVRSRYAC